ncbi:MAG: hypothetical protein KBG02_05875 [Haliscomenobacter sp.]|nr:hypothetical protein [Haliscomenobacter sp.]MBK8656065.1 hypothetical protein [Haliscomenobacter sp.]MBP9076371.1 hypothetical protein [Haliscomenobacter sp.]
MNARIITLFLLFLPFLASAQFQGQAKGKGLTIIVTDGTMSAKDSPLNPPGPNMKDPIRPLGMEETIQAGAFLDRPVYGEYGFILIFSVGDSVGGKQGELEFNGEVYKGVYRLIRQKMKSDEIIPKGKTGYRLQGLVFFLGISGS